MRIERLISLSADPHQRLNHDQLAALRDALDIRSLAIDLAHVQKHRTNQIQTRQAAQHGQ